MRYIIKYNELNRVENMSELREFSRSYLANLIDTGYDIRVIPTFDKKNYMRFDISKRNPSNNIEDSYFEWSDIKDDFIPFIEMLKKSYSIKSIKCEYVFGSYGFKDFKINDDIEDLIPKYYDIIRLAIEI